MFEQRIELLRREAQLVASALRLAVAEGNRERVHNLTERLLACAFEAGFLEGYDATFQTVMETAQAAREKRMSLSGFVDSLHDVAEEAETMMAQRKVEQTH